MHGNFFPHHGLRYEMNRTLVIGNGESRKWFCPSRRTIRSPVVTWGCNAIFRDGPVDVLVAVDYSMQQEIYDSGYALNNPECTDQNVCHFSNWNILPAEAVEIMFMGFDIPEELIHYSNKRTDNCVIQGKDPNTLQEKIKTAIEMNPKLDIPDLVQKMEKDIGVWITYVEKEDNVVPIDFPVGWSAGCTALHLACKNGDVDEIYILGFDLSSYDEDLNNLYKGTENYLPVTAKGFSTVNWMNQMATVFNEFGDKQFYWVDRQFDEKLYFDNVKDLTKTELCDTLNIQ